MSPVCCKILGKIGFLGLHQLRMTSTVITPIQGANPRSGVGVGGWLPPLQIAKGSGGFEGPTWSVVTIYPPLESQSVRCTCFACTTSMSMCAMALSLVLSLSSGVAVLSRVTAVWQDGGVALAGPYLGSDLG